MSSFRVDKDSLGEVQVPSDAYYGAFTARAKEQYTVTGQKPHINLIKAYAMIKKSAALANKELNQLQPGIADAIAIACEEILGNKFHEEFIIDAINSGAGTAFNMNVNEVVANIALEITGNKKGQYEIINPNDHVNMSQSSNDTFPTAMHIAILLALGEMLPIVDKLIESLKKKAREFRDIIKIGRTHLMDALPVTLGLEFEEYAFAIKYTKENLIQSMKSLESIALGGTAVGTGANAPKNYRHTAIKYLSKISGLNLRPSENMFFSLQSRFEVVSCSASIRNLAIELTKMANDLRLMASGPVAGLAEILIPTVHAGSSIMPGKVNPSLAECLNMICFDILGNDFSVCMAAQAGQLELNVMLPGMLKCILDSIDMLRNFLPKFTANMTDGLKANQSRIASYVDKSPVLVTLLNPYIGYLKAAELYKEALDTNTNIKDIILDRGLMTKEEINKALSKSNFLAGE